MKSVYKSSIGSWLCLGQNVYEITERGATASAELHFYKLASFISYFTSSHPVSVLALNVRFTQLENTELSLCN